LQLPAFPNAFKIGESEPRTGKLRKPGKPNKRNVALRITANVRRLQVMVAFNVNGQPVSVDAEDDTPLLWVVREHLQLTGTKFGCGAGLCGACTVHVNGRAVRSCLTPLADVDGATVTTIEGLSADSSHPLQKAWVAEQVPQCGYCQSGQIMKAAELLAQNGNPSRDEIVTHMDGNICRCGTYTRIVAAIQRAAQEG
jgi:isoquinoline 1-oxidoreductase alpha subunit